MPIIPSPPGGQYNPSVHKPSIFPVIILLFYFAKYFINLWYTSSKTSNISLKTKLNTLKNLICRLVLKFALKLQRSEKIVKLRLPQIAVGFSIFLLHFTESQTGNYQGFKMGVVYARNARPSNQTHTKYRSWLLSHWPINSYACRSMYGALVNFK